MKQIHRKGILHMKFLEMFKNKVAIRYLIFGIIIFAATIGLSFVDSANDVAVTFDNESILIKSDSYRITILYSQIADAELTAMADAGESIEGKDTMVLRTGIWTNDAWGEHYICADLDCTQCVVITVDDGRKFVFSRRDNASTEADYNELLTHLK